MLKDIIEAKINVQIIARERGKIVDRREGHNIWVNNGRQYLAEVIAPLDGTFAKHYGEASVIRVVKYMGLGIGGSSQGFNLADPSYATLIDHYPGLNTYTDTVLTTNYLERPVKISGTPGKVGTSGVWLSQVTAPPTYPVPPITKVEFKTFISETDINFPGSTYPIVPLSEIGLFLSDQSSTLDSEQVYDYAVSPYINPNRQKLIAYNTFASIAKTISIALEFHWEISF